MSRLPLMLHELLRRLSPSHIPALASMVGCDPNTLRNAIEAKPGYRDHSIALHRVAAVLRDDATPSEPWPDGVDPAPIIDEARAILAGLRACWSLIPTKPVEQSSVKIVVVPSDDGEQSMLDLRRLAAAGVREVMLADTMHHAQALAAEYGAEHIIQIGWAPGLAMVDGEIVGIEEWAR